jgi:hypothetical protein
VPQSAFVIAKERLGITKGCPTGHSNVVHPENYVSSDFIWFFLFVVYDGFWVA